MGVAIFSWLCASSVNASWRQHVLMLLRTMPGKVLLVVSAACIRSAIVIAANSPVVLQPSTFVGTVPFLIMVSTIINCPGSPLAIIIIQKFQNSCNCVLKILFIHLIYLSSTITPTLSLSSALWVLHKPAGHHSLQRHTIGCTYNNLLQPHLQRIPEITDAFRHPSKDRK